MYIFYFFVLIFTYNNRVSEELKGGKRMLTLADKSLWRGQTVAREDCKGMLFLVYAYSTCA